jgi:hypothetical protein
VLVPGALIPGGAARVTDAIAAYRARSQELAPG